MMTTFRLFTNDISGRSIFEREVDGNHTGICSDDDKNFQRCLSEMHKMIRDKSASSEYLKTLSDIFEHCDKHYNELPADAAARAERDKKRLD
jgi:hypothetical protein